MSLRALLPTLDELVVSEVAEHLLRSAFHWEMFGLPPQVARFARALNLPQQHVFWAVTSPHDDLVAVAIRFENEAFFPRGIDVLDQTVTHRRKTYHVPNTADFWRHEVLQRYCGTRDIHQAMIKGDMLFGIDAADCMFHAPFIELYLCTF